MAAGIGVPVLALVVAQGHGSAAAPEPAGPPPPAVYLPVPFALGINEAVSVPQRFLREGLAPDALEAHLARDAALAAGLGARYVRGNTGAFPRSSWWADAHQPGARDDMDRWVRAVQAAGLEPIAMVSPWPGNRTGAYTRSYLPDDLSAYTAWVGRLVERYDGDGVDDMPGLVAPVRYWEVDNEPDLKFSNVARDAPNAPPAGTLCAPSEAAAVLVATSRAIHEAQPDARVLNGGIYRPFAPNGQDYLRALAAAPGVLDAIDVLSLHCYASDEHGDACARGVRDARRIAAGKPVFVTETSVGSEGDDRWATPEWQARMVAVAAGRGAAEGAQAVLWHSLADPPVRAPHALAHHSLLTMGTDGTTSEKPAARVFRALAARLAATDLAGAIYEGEGAVKLRDGTILLYEGTRAAPGGGVTLVDGVEHPSGASLAAPAFLYPA